MAASVSPSCPPFSRTPHIRQRWLSRQNGNDAALSGGQLDRKIKRAWDQGVPVGLPGRTGSFRLFPPEDVILVESNGVLRTVLARHDQPLNTRHLQECDECAQYLDPSQDYETCPWCDAGNPL